MLVVINRCFGGYSLSEKAQGALIKLGWTEEQAEDASYSSDTDIRSHPDVVQVVDELGILANGNSAELAIVEIPDEPNLKWKIEDYDGCESIHEVHRVWY